MGIRHLLAIMLALVTVLVPVGAADAEVDERTAQAEFVAMINALRTSRGLSALGIDEVLVSEARHWSSVMADDQQLRHAPDLSIGVSAGWDVLGENVGVHAEPDLERLFMAFVGSPSHLANLVDPRFDRVGVGVVFDDHGAVWTTQRFLSGDREASAAPAVSFS